MGRQRRASAAFAPAEIMIIVAALAVLAAAIVPRFSRAGTDTRLSELTTILQTVRGQLLLYKSQHRGRFPTLASFAGQMTLHTDADGSSSPSRTDGRNLGPYLTAIPTNPFTGTNQVGGSDIGSGAAWYYDERTGEFRANDSPEHAGL